MPTTVYFEFPPLQQNEIAELLGLSKSRVQQIEAAALAKMREHPLAAELFEALSDRVSCPRALAARVEEE